MNTTYTGKNLRREETGQGVKKIIFTRPELRNAFNAEMIVELTYVLEQLAFISDMNVMRLLILSGEGKVFCAGADLNYMKEQAQKNEEQNLADACALGKMFFHLASFPCPVVCLVQGAAIAGGLGLAACADFVLAEETAVFATSEVLLGIIPALISPYIIRKIGVAHATPLMLTGKQLTASECLYSGLVSKVTAKGTLNSEADKVAKEFLLAAPHAARRTKELIQNAVPLPTKAQFEYTTRQIAAARKSAEAEAGLHAFFEKTRPFWQL